MTFLPIVERELRVVARKRSTFWLRVVAAAVALFIGACGLFLARAGGVGPFGPGRFLFGALTWPLVCALFATGLFFTSDCLSEEKREGTLGFLFLTDLRGYDVVAGKLLATTLRSLFPLLAFFPILAVTLLMGGVTGGQFWKTSLALLNALFFSLATGLFVSAISRDSQKALAATLLLLLLFILGGPIADASIAAAAGRGFQPLFSFSSPGFVFKAAGGWGRTFFWHGFATTQVIAWLLFALACLLIPRTWQQKTSRTTVASRSWTYSWKYGGSARRARRRRKLLLPNPMLWLTSRECWQAIGIWIIAVLALAGFSLLLLEAPGEAWIAWSFVGGLLMLVLYLWAASQSCRFFVEARRSGLIELLLATPLSEVNIVRGHWRGLVRMFAAPILILICLQLVGVALSQSSMQRMISSATTTSTVTTNSAGSTTVAVNATSSLNTSPFARLTRVEWTTVLTVAFASAAASAANIVALCWFGMWMGISSKNANIATLLTLVFVQVIPWIIIGIGSTMLSGLLLAPFLSGAGAGMFSSYQLVRNLVAALLCLVKDFAFIVWSRKRLYSSFRARVLRAISPPILAIPPPISAPPVIPSPAT
jgi:ABC-type transport system involved in multi-copper enzyme maturation permease subunit